jgi:ketol-acid reductoisomerase
MFLAQYKVLRENGHTPSEAFNETVEEATQSLFPLIGANGNQKESQVFFFFSISMSYL